MSGLKGGYYGGSTILPRGGNENDYINEIYGWIPNPSYPKRKAYYEYLTVSRLMYIYNTLKKTTCLYSFADVKKATDYYTNNPNFVWNTENGINGEKTFRIHMNTLYNSWPNYVDKRDLSQ